MKIVNEDSLKCSTCARCFSSKADLLRHMGTNAYPCPDCEESFAKKGELYDHIKMIHSIANPYRCTECTESFRNKTHLYEHMRSHPDFDWKQKLSEQQKSIPEIQTIFVECNETIKAEVKEEPSDEEFDESLHYAFSADINVKEEPKISDDLDKVGEHSSQIIASPIKNNFSIKTIVKDQSILNPSCPNFGM